MKKAMTVFLSVCFTLSMVACSSTVSQSDLSDESSIKSDEILMESGNVTAEESAEGGKASLFSQYAIGDIILADGSVVNETDLTAIDSGNVPIAVIAGFQEDGTAFGVGVHRSDTPLQWAADNSMGYAVRFTATVCSQASDGAFSGDKDGSDNWDMDCDITVKGTDGKVLYVSNNKEIMDYFADLVEKLDEDDLELSCQGEVLYEYIMRDNNKKVSFYLYEPGNILSCGVGRIQAYFKLSDEMREIFMNPEKWLVTE